MIVGHLQCLDMNCFRICSTFYFTRGKIYYRGVSALHALMEMRLLFDLAHV